MWCDLAWLAIGRLFHETDNYVEAAEAYSHVDRGSPEFSTMLYELAWVYVRLGDFERAQRALEVLTITDPNNPRIGRWLAAPRRPDAARRRIPKRARVVQGRIGPLRSHPATARRFFEVDQ